MKIDFIYYRAAKQHQKQQKKAANHFNDLLPPSFLSTEDRNQGKGSSGSQLQHRSSHPNELFGTQYHPSKYSRDPQTMTTIQLSAVLDNKFELRGPSGTKVNLAMSDLNDMTWDLNLPPFSREAQPHARPATESPPYGVANC